MVNSIDYSIRGNLVHRTAQGADFPARLVSLDGQRVATGKDFDTDTGKLTAENTVQVDAERDLVLLRGSVPGPKGSIVVLREAVKAHG